MDGGVSLANRAVPKAARAVIVMHDGAMERDESPRLGGGIQFGIRRCRRHGPPFARGDQYPEQSAGMVLLEGIELSTSPLPRHSSAHNLMIFNDYMITNVNRPHPWFPLCSLYP